MLRASAFQYHRVCCTPHSPLFLPNTFSPVPASSTFFGRPAPDSLPALSCPVTLSGRPHTAVPAAHFWCRCCQKVILHLPREHLQQAQSPPHDQNLIPHLPPPPPQTSSSAHPSSFLMPTTHCAQPCCTRSKHYADSWQVGDTVPAASSPGGHAPEWAPGAFAGGILPVAQAEPPCSLAAMQNPSCINKCTSYKARYTWPIRHGMENPLSVKDPVKQCLVPRP